MPTPRSGDAAILDNLPAHKVAGVREAIEAVGASARYLSLCSPEFNPIEQVFAKLKALLRKATARTKEALWTAIADAIDAATPAERCNYFSNSGYELERSENALGCSNVLTNGDSPGSPFVIQD